MAATQSPSSNKWMNYLTESVNLEVDGENLGGGFLWAEQQFPEQGDCSVDGSGRQASERTESDKDTSGPGNRKRSREEPTPDVLPGSKANREKVRRDRLNDRFAELGRALEPGKPLKSDKASILSDAVRVLAQLRAEATTLRESNSQLVEQLKELKVEKMELREEKTRLKQDKERLEQQLKSVAAPAAAIPPQHPHAHPHAAPQHMAFLPPPLTTAAPPAMATQAAAMQAAAAAAAAYAAQAHQQHQFMMHKPPGTQADVAPYAIPMGAPPTMLPHPVAAYDPQMAMWQWLPANACDTSQDHMLRPPVA